MAKKKSTPAPAPPAQPTTPETPATKVVHHTTVVQAPPPPAADERDAWDLDENEETAEADTSEQPAAATAPSATPPADETPSPVVEQPAVHKHSKRLVKEALDWQFSQSQIDGMASEDLEDALYERQRAWRLAQEQQRQQAEKPKPDPEQEPEFELPPEAANYDEESKKVLKAIGSKQAKEVAALKKQLADMEKRDQERTQRENQRIFTGLLEKHKTIFTEDAAGRARAQAMIGYLSTIQEPKGLEADFESGVKLLFGAAAAPAPTSPPPPPAPAPDPLAQRKEEFTNGTVARPTERKEPPPKPGDALALQNLKKRLGEGTATLLNGNEKQAFFDDPNDGWFRD